ncbi:hypothetical protein O3M35_010672 [Rhynocoris fuscipes]|uniref:Uncharacterized protein n=1 Tax=Rhynocoris fuscipes TaxID=488301 RepID=A0AAW1D156_9HEMI
MRYNNTKHGGRWIDRIAVCVLSIVSPEVAVPGKLTAALVSINQHDNEDHIPVNVTLRLISGLTRELLAQNTSTIQVRVYPY